MRRGLLKEYSSTVGYLNRIVDCCIGVVSGFLAYAIYPGTYPINEYYLSAIILSILLIVFIFPRYSLYKMWRGMSIFEELKYIIAAWVSIVLLLILIAVLTKTSEIFSRIWMGLWALSGILLLVISRVIIRNILGWMREKGLNTRNIVLVGNNSLSEDIATKIEDEAWAGFHLKGVFAKEYDPMDTQLGHPVLGGIDAIGEYVEKNKIDQVWIAMPLREEEVVKEILNELRLSTVDICYVPDIFGLNLFNHSISEVVGYPVINLSASPMVGTNKIIKIFEDRALSLVLFVIFFPLMLLIGLMVKLSSNGPMLFKQKRHGWDGKEINIYKFRTMEVHYEPEDTITQAVIGDVRITRFGAFLRRTSLDELPQLYNVLQGRMSLVGPRPHAIEHNIGYREKIDQYMLRHKVKPGITGWAQVNGYRGETDTIDKMKKRVEYDIYYIENWSFWLDLKILFLTIFKGFTNKNAY